MNRINLPEINQIKQHRQPDGHKKSFGHVLIIAGSPGKVGAALCAQEFVPDVAVRLGAYIHGLSADLAIQKKSKASLVASDLIDHLSEIRLLD